MEDYKTIGKELSQGSFGQLFAFILLELRVEGVCIPKWLPQALFILEGCNGSYLPFEALIRVVCFGAHGFMRHPTASLQRRELSYAFASK